MPQNMRGESAPHQPDEVIMHNAETRVSALSIALNNAEISAAAAIDSATAAEQRNVFQNNSAAQQQARQNEWEAAA